VSYWRKEARALIAELTADLPADATLAQRRKALWGKGWPAHQGTSWGRKMWGKEVRAYLGRHGDATATLTTREPVFPDHVHFPWKGESADG
jgi:hypothetical protein